jgi:hypothetical protein
MSIWESHTISIRPATVILIECDQNSREIRNFVILKGGGLNKEQLINKFGYLIFSRKYTKPALYTKCIVAASLNGRERVIWVRGDTVDLKDLGKIKVADLTAPQRFGHGIRIDIA